MTDNEIIKAFEICYTDSEEGCSDCPMRDENGFCKDAENSDILHDITDLIHRQQAEIKDLKLSNIILKAKMTIEFVPKENPHLLRYIIRGSGYTAQGESLLDAMKAFEEKVIAGLDAEEHNNIANKRAAKGGEEQ